MPEKITVSEYYIIKQKYNRGTKNNIKKLLKSSESKADKRSKLEAIIKTMPCPNPKCKQPGPIQFTSDATHLKMNCPNPKCKFYKISIPRSNVTNIFDEFERVSIKCNKLKEDVVQIKLDLFFKYIDESEAISKFSSVKNDLSKINTEMISLSEQINSITSVNDAYAPLKQEYETILDEITGLVKEDNDITTIVEFHIDRLMPVAKQLREMKYKYNLLEDIKGKEAKNNNLSKSLYLRQTIYSLEDLEIKID